MLIGVDDEVGHCQAIEGNRAGRHHRMLSLCTYSVKLISYQVIMQFWECLVSLPRPPACVCLLTHARRALVIPVNITAATGFSIMIIFCTVCF